MQPTLDAAVAPIQDVIARFKEQHSDFNELPSKAVFTMNDTHPTIAVAELMRLLIDQEGLEWDNAWAITTKVIHHPMHYRRKPYKSEQKQSFEDVVCSFRTPHGAVPAQADFWSPKSCCWHFIATSVVCEHGTLLSVCLSRSSWFTLVIAVMLLMMPAAVLQGCRLPLPLPSFNFWLDMASTPFIGSLWPWKLGFHLVIKLSVLAVHPKAR